mmetsp:Transcript_18881/g.49376  ORF Transcript_18881/g.49376 Transcript_18881/m.49376 type:complete len:316 (-) Transcript_18881:421-1368(-)
MHLDVLHPRERLLNDGHAARDRLARQHGVRKPTVRGLMPAQQRNDVEHRPPDLPVSLGLGEVERAQHAVQLLHIPHAALGHIILQVLGGHARQRHAGVAPQRAAAQLAARHLCLEVSITKDGAGLDVEGLVALVRLQGGQRVGLGEQPEQVGHQKVPRLVRRNAALVRGARGAADRVQQQRAHPAARGHLVDRHPEQHQHARAQQLAEVPVLPVRERTYPRHSRDSEAVADLLQSLVLGGQQLLREDFVQAQLLQRVVPFRNLTRAAKAAQHARLLHLHHQLHRGRFILRLGRVALARLQVAVQHRQTALQGRRC